VAAPATQPAVGGEHMTDPRHPRTVVAVRAHEPTPATLSMYREAVACFGPEQAYVVTDEYSSDRRTPWPDDVSRVPVTPELLDYLRLRRDVPDVAWRCGDYAYYALAETVPFDRAWLVEPDVGLYGLSLRDIVDRFDGHRADYLSGRLHPVGDEFWEWTRSLTARGVSDPWRSFFPLTRASRSAVDAALDLRRRTQHVATSESLYPNDEIILATAVGTSSRLVTADLVALAPSWFAYFDHFDGAVKQHRSTLERRFAPPQVFHPALDDDDYVAFLGQRIAHARDLGPRRLLREVVDRAGDLGPQQRHLLRRTLRPHERALLLAQRRVEHRRRRSRR
jgi:hypothetical protein